MKPRDPGLDPEWRAFLRGRRVARMPPEMRARVVARGRAIVAGGGVPSPSAGIGSGPAAAAPSRSLRRQRVLWRTAMAASVALAAGAVGAVAALHHRPPPPAVPAQPIGQEPWVCAGPAAPPPAPAPPPKLDRPRRQASVDPFTAELELLQRAHAAYGRQEFPAALALIGEHARRFPRGRLAEEREALRVRALAGAGRTEEAQRAAAAFDARFPRSVLLQRFGDPQKALE